MYMKCLMTVVCSIFSCLFGCSDNGVVQSGGLPPAGNPPVEYEEFGLEASGATLTFRPVEEKEKSAEMQL